MRDLKAIDHMCKLTLERVNRREESCVCFEDLWTLQEMEQKREDGLLQMVCYRAGNEKELEMEDKKEE